MMTNHAVVAFNSEKFKDSIKCAVMQCKAVVFFEKKISETIYLYLFLYSGTNNIPI